MVVGTGPRLSSWQRRVPGIGVVRTYKPRWLRFDLVAGVVLAAILVPQGMAYAELAGVPPVYGLYTTIACLVGYALLGPSKILVLGPDASVAPLVFVAIAPLLVTDDPTEAVALASMLALMVGVVQVGLGLGKLGFVADLLSKEVQVGYMNGLAVTIVVGQLPKLFGFSTDADGFMAELKAFVRGTGRDQHDCARRRSRHPRRSAHPSSCSNQGSCGARSGAGGHGCHRCPRPGREGCGRRRAAAPGTADAHLPVRDVRDPRAAVRRLARHRPCLVDGPDRYLDQLCCSPR